MEREAQYYEKKDDEKVRCVLCPHMCVIAPGKSGICGVRENRDGALRTMIYGEVSSISMDPIEKKPLYHFYPGSSILSIGTVGCSFRCQFCQNYSISQNPHHTTETYSTEELVEYALRNRSVGIAYTYSEPLIWFEFVLDTCMAVRESGLKNVFVTNGYINKEPLEKLLPYADAFNIDLKSFRDDFYKKVIGGSLQPVLDTIREVAAHEEICMEVTTLVIPGYNDSSEEMEEITDFISGLSPEIPFHLSAYHPMYKFNAPPTSYSTLQRMRDIASKKLNYVYLGNVHEASNTYCKNCGAVIIERKGYATHVKNYHNGKCTSCGEPVPVMG